MVQTPKNSLQLYRQVAALRHLEPFSNNRISYCILTEDIFSYVRQSQKNSYLIVINVGNTTTTENYANCNYSSKYGISIVVTPNIHTSSLQPGGIINLEGLTLRPGDGIVLRLQ